jgi:hypothetical protein
MERTIRRSALIACRRVLPIGLAALLCAVLLAACAGGSGSSGFDLALKKENEAIDRALATSGCETNAGLTICASSGSAPAAP